MCDNCKKAPYHFRGDKHEQVACPFKTSLFCSSCSTYGHSQESCPAPPDKFYTEPCYVEQLVPASLLKYYGITTNTLLPDIKPPKKNPERFLEIKDDIKIIKAFLVSRSIIGPRMEDATKLRDALILYAKRENLRLIFMDAE